MTTTDRRGRGRPALSREGAARAHNVRLPPELDAAAERVKGRLSWSEWLRGLVEREVERPTPRVSAGANCARCGHCRAVHTGTVYEGGHGCRHCICARWID